MQKRTLGRTGFRVTEIGFGAWAIGGGHLNYGPVSEEQAHACIAAYIEQGGNFIDTAQAYGESERILGDFFERTRMREEMFVSSKTYRLEPGEIRRELQETLHLLRSDYVDIYFLHMPPDDQAEMNRVLDVYEQLKGQGKIRAIGASVKGADVTPKTVELCRQYIRSGRVDVLMVIFSILRQKNSEILQEAMDNGVGVVARTVLESGFLTGKYSPGHDFTGRDHRTRWERKRLTGILECAQDLSREHVLPPYKTLSQLAIRFALDEERISSVVLGATSVEQVEENMQVSGLPPLEHELKEHLISTYGERTDEFNTGQ